MTDAKGQELRAGDLVIVAFRVSGAPPEHGEIGLNTLAQDDHIFVNPKCVIRANEGDGVAIRDAKTKQIREILIPQIQPPASK